MAPQIEVLAVTPVPEPYYSSGLRARYELDGMHLDVSTSSKSNTTQSFSKQPSSIGYETDEVQYRERGRKRYLEGGLETQVPPGFAPHIKGPLVWTGSDFEEDEATFVYLLDAQDKAEIHTALSHFKEQELDGDQVTPTSFPLPNLSDRLQQVKDDVYHGRGFAIIRGLQPQDYSVEDFAVVYLGLTSYVAAHRGKQDQRGSMLMHVMRRGTGSHADDIYSSDKPFHTDTVCDVLCLVTKSCGAKGGRSVLASAWSVYNHLAATRPDLIHILAKPDWPFDTYGREPAYYRRALLYMNEGKAILNLSRRLLVGHPPNEPRSSGIPSLNEAQAEAIDAVHFTARQFELHTTLQKGDIRLINNMAVLHRREAFEDQGETIRHLIRVWLHNPDECWKLPTPLKLAWDRVFDDPERSEHWDIHPLRKNGVLLRVAGSCD